MNKKAQIKTIIGVDPGTSVTGYAIITNEDVPQLVVSGIIDLRKISNPHEKLKTIFSVLYQLIGEFKPDEFSIEAPFYGKNVQSMLKLGRAQGVALTCGMIRGLETHEYSPRKIKQSVTGNGNSSKEQLKAMLSQMMHVDLSAKSLDETDAIATAYCHFIHLNSFQGITGNKYSGWEEFIKNNPDRMG